MNFKLLFAFVCIIVLIRIEVVSLFKYDSDVLNKIIDVSYFVPSYQSYLKFVVWWKKSHPYLNTDPNIEGKQISFDKDISFK